MILAIHDDSIIAGEPEFRRNGDIATHTITLRLDMTELDLHHAQPTCCKNDLRKYGIRPLVHIDLSLHIDL